MENQTKEILEIVQFLKGNTATKDELRESEGRVLEVVSFVKDNAVTKDEASTKEDLAAMEYRIRKYLAEATLASEQRLKEALTTHIDSFIVLNQKIDVELVVLRAKYQRLEEEHQELKTQMGAIMKRLQMEPA